MILRLKALRSLRLNLKRRAVLLWPLGAPSLPCEPCEGTGFQAGLEGLPIFCRRCMGDGTNPGLKLGWERILHEPQAVIAEQEAMAEGVFV